MPQWEVDASALDGGVRLADESRRVSRVSRVVELYLGGLKAFRRSDDKIDVVFCVIPDIVLVTPSRFAHLGTL